MRKRFSGYLVVDELYDGPYAVVYAVDPIAEMDVWFRILPRATEPEMRKFLIQIRFLVGSVKAITTDASPLYTEAVPKVYPRARHQICRFHILHVLNTGVFEVLSRVRKALAKKMRKLTVGQPRKGQGAKDDPYRVLKEAIFEHRRLWVKRKLSPREVRILRHLCRNQALLADLRAFVDNVYRLFDRRCNRETALRKLRRLRSLPRLVRHEALSRVLRKIRSPNLEKALWFLDDDLLESTSNAVERRNRKHRKFQKTVYRVRAKHAIEGRIKYDFMRRMRLKKEQMALNSARRRFSQALRFAVSE